MQQISLRQSMLFNVEKILASNSQSLTYRRRYKNGEMCDWGIHYQVPELRYTHDIVHCCCCCCFCSCWYYCCCCWYYCCCSTQKKKKLTRTTNEDRDHLRDRHIFRRMTLYLCKICEINVIIVNLRIHLLLGPEIQGISIYCLFCARESYPTLCVCVEKCKVGCSGQ